MIFGVYRARPVCAQDPETLKHQPLTLEHKSFSPSEEINLASRGSPRKHGPKP